MIFLNLPNVILWDRVFFEIQPPPPTDFTLNDVQLNVISHLKLLGLQSKMIWSGTYMWKTLCPKPLENDTLSAFWRSVKPSLRTLLTVLCCYIRPVLEYACPVWHILHWQKLKLTKLNLYKREPFGSYWVETRQGTMKLLMCVNFRHSIIIVADTPRNLWHENVILSRIDTQGAFMLNFWGQNQRFQTWLEQNAVASMLIFE